MQDFYDILQVLDYLYEKLDNEKAELGINYIARIDEDLLPVYPAILINVSPVTRELHATQIFRVQFNLDIWVFHAELTVGKAIRSREDVKLATRIRKFLHEDYTLGGHIIFGFVDGEFPGQTTRVAGQKASTVVTTRLTWVGENRVPYGFA